MPLREIITMQRSSLLALVSLCLCLFVVPVGANQIVTAIGNKQVVAPPTNPVNPAPPAPPGCVGCQCANVTGSIIANQTGGTGKKPIITYSQARWYYTIKPDKSVGAPVENAAVNLVAPNAVANCVNNNTSQQSGVEIYYYSFSAPNPLPCTAANAPKVGQNMLYPAAANPPTAKAGYANINGPDPFNQAVCIPPVITKPVSPSPVEDTFLEPIKGKADGLLARKQVVQEVKPASGQTQKKAILVEKDTSTLKHFLPVNRFILKKPVVEF